MPLPGGFLGCTAVVQVVAAVSVEAVAGRRCAKDRDAEINGVGLVVCIPAPEQEELLFRSHRFIPSVCLPLDFKWLTVHDPSLTTWASGEREGQGDPLSGGGRGAGAGGLAAEQLSDQRGSRELVLKMHLLFLRLVIVFDRFAPFEKTLRRVPK